LFRLPGGSAVSPHFEDEPVFAACAGESDLKGCAFREGASSLRCDRGSGLVVEGLIRVMGALCSRAISLVGNPAYGQL